MVLLHSPCRCINTTSFFSFQSRLKFEDVNLSESSPKDIRHHCFIVAIFLRLFSNQMIVTIKDIDLNVYYLNRGSLINWLQANDYRSNNEKSCICNYTENELIDFLNVVLQNKSPAEHQTKVILLNKQLQNGSNFDGMQRCEERKDVENEKIRNEELAFSRKLDSQTDQGNA